MKLRRRTRRRLKRAGIAVGLIACVAAVTGVAVSAMGDRTPPPVSAKVQQAYDDSSAKPGAAAKQKVAAFLGDSYTAGSGANPGGGYAMLLSRDMGWEVKLFGQGGTGYTNHGQADQKEVVFGGRMADVIAEKPDIVIVQGSTNDYDLAATRAAADTVFSHLRAKLPKAKIVAVGPLDTPGAAADLLDASRSGVAAAAAENKVTFVDPIKLGWMPDDALYPDGIHPSQEGHRMMADLLRKALAGAGITPAPW